MGQEIPLIDWHVEFINGFILPVLGVVTFFFILAGRRLFYYTMLLVFISGTLTFVFKYSVIKAFQPVSLLIGLYILITRSLEEESKKLSAQIFLFLVFFFSAIQKLNISYFEGTEFSTHATFFSNFFSVFPHLEEWEPILKMFHFPALTVGLELLIATLALLRPALASLVTLCFLLFLSLINHYVNYVFLLLIPVCLNLNPRFNENLNKSLFSPHFKSVFFWWVLYYVWNSLPRNFAMGYFLTVLPFILFLILYTTYLQFPLPKIDEFRLVNFRILNFRAIFPSLLICVYFAGNLIFLPGPIGFSMFASKSFKHGWHMLEIDSHLGCQWLKNKVKIMNVSDVRFGSISSSSCFLKTATQGGLSFTFSRICEKDRSSSFIYVTSQNSEKSSISCESGWKNEF